MRYFTKTIILVILILLTLNACSSTSKSANIISTDIMGVEWVLAEIRTGSKNIVLNRTSSKMKGFENSFTLYFDDNRLSGVGAPNRFFAPYKFGKNQTITVQPIASTLMASIHELEILKEHEYFNFLQNVYKWNIVGGKLELYTRNGDVETVLIYNLK